MDAPANFTQPTHVGSHIHIPSALNPSQMMEATVLKKFRRWALVRTEYGYRTTVWLDKRGNIVA